VAGTRTIELRTEIPGPRTREVLQRRERSVAGPVIPALPLVIAEGFGALLTDVDGNTFVDFVGGVGCMNVGHSHPRVVSATQEQLERMTHTCFTSMGYESYIALAERLTALAPVPAPAKAAFFNTGAEAVENAVKFARSYTKRPAVLAFEGAFHGRTLLALTMTSKTRTKTGIGPFAPEVYRVPFPNSYRGPNTDQALAAIERTFLTNVPPEHVAAIVVEAVQGEGGFLVAPPGFLEGLRRICDEHGILLVIDEVQTGFGRTGRLFATEHFGVQPDLLLVAKSIAAGLPLSGVVGRGEVMDSAGAATIGGTFVGNPVALAAAHAVLDVIEEERLVERAEEIGDVMRDRMQAWQERWAEIGDVRGLGAMLTLEFVRDRATKEPAPELAEDVIRAALDRGLILTDAGVHLNCVRELVPLVISDGELDDALDAWEGALEAVLGA
jgi:4-aminobutyrate aminotransferase / (S)-3-amino-2-methylpropionate transaminase / 5-aminovalerate transaminase